MLKINPDPLTLLRPVSKVITVGKTRPGDTTTYAAGDVIAESTSAATVWTFPGFARSAGLGGILQGAELIGSTAQTLKLDAELHLFDVAPVTQNDNVAWAPSDTEIESSLGFVSFATASWKTAGANGLIAAEGIAKVMQCAAGQTSLFGILIARNAYVPTSGEKWTVRLHCIQD
jgi:hypothetical protein